MTDGEIAGVMLDHEAMCAGLADAHANIVTMGRTVIARTHRGEQVAILEHERVGFERKTRRPGMIEVRLIERDRALCYIPADALAREGAQ